MPRLARHDPIASNPILIQTPPPPPKVGVELLKLFYWRSCKVFYGRAGKLAAAVLRDDHELLKLPGTVRCFRELMERIRRNGTIWLLSFPIPDMFAKLRFSRDTVLHANSSPRRFFFEYFSPKKIFRGSSRCGKS